MKRQNERRNAVVLLLALAGMVAAAASGWAGSQGEGATDSSMPFAGRSLVVFASSDGPADNKRIGPYVPMFEEETGATVEWVEMRMPDVRQRFSTIAATRGANVDVIATSTALTAEYASAGWLVDITDLLTAEHKADLAAANGASYKGRLYGLPDSGDLKLFYWNKRLFREAGLDPDTPPDTMDQVIEFARAIKNRGTGEHYGFQTHGFSNGTYTMFDYQILYYMSGQDGFFDANDNPVFNRPAALRALQYYKVLHDEQLIDPAMETITGYEEYFQRFSEGLSGMAFGWTSLYGYATTRPSSKIQNDIGVGPLPAIERRASITGNQGFAISAFSENQDLALEFIKFLNRPENTRDMSLRTGFLPGRKSAYDHPSIRESHLAPMLAVAAAQEQEFNSRFAAPYATEFMNEGLGFALIKVISGEMAPEEALDWAEDKAQEIVAKYK